MTEKKYLFVAQRLFDIVVDEHGESGKFTKGSRKVYMHYPRCAGWSIADLKPSKECNCEVVFLAVEDGVVTDVLDVPKE